MGIDKSLVNIGKYHYKRFGGASWLLIFYHNVKLGGLFQNEAEARANDNPYKFSLLDEIKDDERFKYDGKYEFLIHFSGKKGFNRWRQSNFPLNEDDNKASGETVDGYENVSISWTDKLWGGLAKTVNYSGKCIPCLLDGSIGAINYHYAIGNYGCNNQYIDSTPSNDLVGVNEVALWVRVSSIQINAPLTCRIKTTMNKLISIAIILIDN